MKRLALDVRVANCAAVSAPKRARGCVVKALTEKNWHGGLPDVVLFSEVSPVNVELVAHNLGYDVVQFGKPGSPQAGVAIAVHRETMRRPHRTKYVLGSPATREGGGIRERPMVSAKVRPKEGARGVRVWAGHAPPPRSPLARALYMARTRGLRGAVGADFNMTSIAMRSSSERLYKGIGVLGLLVPVWAKASTAHAVEIGSDHSAVDVILYL